MNNFLNTAWWIIHPMLVPIAVALAVCVLVLLTHLHMHPQDRWRIVAVTMQKTEHTCWWLLGATGRHKPYVRAALWRMVPKSAYDRAWNGMFHLDVRSYHRLAHAVGEMCFADHDNVMHMRREGVEQ